MNDVRLTLLVKPGCHLCDDARAVIDGVLESQRLCDAGVRVSVTELNILEDDELRARYAEEIPVVLINDQQHSYWHVSPDRLAEALVKGAQ